MSDSDRVSLLYVAENTFGVTPTTPTMQQLRFTQESLMEELTSTPSQEIRDDRQIAQVVRTGVAAKGGIGLELSYNTYDDFLQAGLQSAGWSTVRTATGAIVAANPENTLTLTGAFTNFAVGQWVKLSGFVNAANNGYAKISAKTNDSITLTGITLVDENGSGATATMGAQIVNGTTYKSFTIEKRNTDLTNVLALYTGMTPSSFDLSIKNDQVITGMFNFMGKREEATSATVASSVTAPNTNKIISSVDEVVALLKSLTSHPSTELSFSLNNNIRSRTQIGTLGAVSHGSGTVNVTGKLVTYFSKNDILTEYLTFASIALAVVAQDVAGNAYLIECPEVKFTAGQRIAGGQNQDVLADMSWYASRHPTEGITIRIARFAA